MVTEQSVSASMEKLVAAINQLTDLVRTAADEMHEEPNRAVEEKLDILIKQNGDLLGQNSELVKHNEEMRSSLLLLLELNRQRQSPFAGRESQPSPEPTTPKMEPPAPPAKRNIDDDLGESLLGLPPDLPVQ